MAGTANITSHMSIEALRARRGRYRRGPRGVIGGAPGAAVWGALEARGPVPFLGRADEEHGHEHGAGEALREEDEQLQEPLPHVGRRLLLQRFEEEVDEVRDLPGGRGGVKSGLLSFPAGGGVEAGGGGSGRGGSHVRQPADGVSGGRVEQKGDPVLVLVAHAFCHKLQAGEDEVRPLRDLQVPPEGLRKARRRLKRRPGREEAPASRLWGLRGKGGERRGRGWRSRSPPARSTWPGTRPACRPFPWLSCGRGRSRRCRNASGPARRKASCRRGSGGLGAGGWGGWGGAPQGEGEPLGVGGSNLG